MSRILASLEDFLKRLEEKEPIKVTKVTKEETPDGPLHTFKEEVLGWAEAVEAAYKLGIRDGQEGIDFCFNPYVDGKGQCIDINNDRKDAWAKGWMEIHEKSKGQSNE